MKITEVHLDYYEGHDSSNDLICEFHCNRFSRFKNSIFDSILQTEKIPASGFGQDSQNEEDTANMLFNPFTEKMQRYVDFYRCSGLKLGIILDIDKLSERYEITGYNGYFEELRLNGLDVHRIIAYKDDTYEMDGIGIDGEVYNVIRECFLALSDEDKKAMNVVISQKGKSPKRGVELAEHISCCKRDFYVHVSPDKLSCRQLYDISVYSRSKPLIWLEDDEDSIDVSGCIAGIFSLRRMHCLTKEEEIKIIEWLRPLCEKYGKDLRHEWDAKNLFVYDYFVMY